MPFLNVFVSSEVLIGGEEGEGFKLSRSVCQRCDVAPYRFLLSDGVELEDLRLPV